MIAEIKEAYNNILRRHEIVRYNQEIRHGDWHILMNYTNKRDQRIEVTVYRHGDSPSNASWKGFKLGGSTCKDISDWVDYRSKGELTGKKKTLNNTCKLHYLLLS